MTVSTKAPLGSCRSRSRPSGPSCQLIASPSARTVPPVGLPSLSKRFVATNSCSMVFLRAVHPGGGHCTRFSQFTRRSRPPLESLALTPDFRILQIHDVLDRGVIRGVRLDGRVEHHVPD